MDTIDVPEVTQVPDLGEVRMVLYTREDDTAYAVYAQALEQLLGAGADSSV
jgi:hypothetical protein